MELRQLRYFVKIVELGSMGRAANELEIAQSALSQQVSRLESELCTRLFIRDPRGVSPTEAGVAFFREAQLTLQHASQAVRAAQQSRFSGTVTVGLASTTAAILGLDLMKTMCARYPDVRLNLVENMSGNLAAMLGARELDFAILFDSPLLLEQSRSNQRRWEVQELIEEKLFWINSAKARRSPSSPKPNAMVSLRELKDEPLILPTASNRLRSILNAAFANVDVVPKIAMEVDSLSIVMSGVDAGHGSTILPWAALLSYGDTDQRFRHREILELQARRKNLLYSQMEDELSPAALATKVVLIECVRTLVERGRWLGALPIHKK